MHISPKAPKGRRFFPRGDIMRFYGLVTLATIALALPTPDLAMNEEKRGLNSRFAFEPEEDKAPSAAAIIPQDLVRRSWLDDTLKVITSKEPLIVPFIW